MKPFLSVIIPAYNEEKRLPATLIDVDRYLRSADFSCEIIVVDDGSKDGTAEIVKKFEDSIGNLRLIKNEENHGKGHAVKQGMLAAEGEYRLFMDADNSTSVDQFQKILPFLKEGYEVIIGSRDIKGAELVPPQPLYKRALGNIGNLVIQILLLWGIWDTQCGFKCFSGKATQRIFSLVTIERWGFDVEALALGKKMGYKIKEVPVRWVNNPYSQVKLSGYLTSLWDVFKIRFRLWKGDYKYE
ncbi:MAG: hypothetical protein UY26_C0003G0250 [Candidatus Jorgensenbacteria bacterium GW2011_GWA1_48_13]|uniref:dolichyl-phosphate beta-glucosyltransferase n=2 Tax=Candidatus Joergenseniibacteriota TaxID=1752739 RepID=A0A0G1Z7E6_9BACT|nr:MAG: hypothetical protein UY26_C0003G0250 [Candidatus Jorgensenbacteria bacterium GW2011_GWA1_48_13]KKW14864.1 MAG: hypothetical protein UY55_C0003G0081 [Candidatus Jorgensenbacteria bacterium GW2011_GWB1_50_10]